MENVIERLKISKPITKYHTCECGNRVLTPRPCERFTLSYKCDECHRVFLRSGVIMDTMEYISFRKLSQLAVLHKSFNHPLIGEVQMNGYMITDKLDIIPLPLVGGKLAKAYYDNELTIHIDDSEVAYPIDVYNIEKDIQDFNASPPRMYSNYKKFRELNFTIIDYVLFN